MENLLSRKFIVTVLVLIADFVFVLEGIATYEQFAVLAATVMGIYVTGNVATKIVLSKK